MTEHATMNTIIHAAFRRDLHRFDQALAVFPADSPLRAKEIATAWDNFSSQLHHHHEDEENIFWPVLRSLGANESMAGDLEGEHAQMVLALDRANDAVSVLRTTGSSADAARARQAIDSLASVLLNHLAHEERDLEPFAAKQHRTPQIAAAQKAVRKAHRGNHGTFLAWVLDGADADAVRGVRREVPWPVLFVISKVGGRRYRRTIAPVWL
jgi:iron-sulfur cluster repair protein YtfE (RIC family)